MKLKKRKKIHAHSDGVDLSGKIVVEGNEEPEFLWPDPNACRYIFIKGQLKELRSFDYDDETVWKIRYSLDT